jgi:hypothetical protein
MVTILKVPWTNVVAYLALLNGYKEDRFVNTATDMFQIHQLSLADWHT